MCTDGSHALSFASPITQSLIFIQSVEVINWKNHSKLNVPMLHIPARLIINTKLEEAFSSISTESMKCVHGHTKPAALFLGKTLLFTIS